MITLFVVHGCYNPSQPLKILQQIRMDTGPYFRMFSPNIIIPRLACHSSTLVNIGHMSLRFS